MNDNIQCKARSSLCPHHEKDKLIEFPLLTPETFNISITASNERVITKVTILFPSFPASLWDLLKGNLWNLTFNTVEKEIQFNAT